MQFIKRDKAWSVRLSKGKEGRTCDIDDQLFNQIWKL